MGERRSLWGEFILIILFPPFFFFLVDFGTAMGFCIMGFNFLMEGRFFLIWFWIGGSRENTFFSSFGRKDGLERWDFIADLWSKWVFEVQMKGGILLTWFWRNSLFLLSSSESEVSSCILGFWPSRLADFFAWIEKVREGQIQMEGREQKKEANEVDRVMCPFLIPQLNWYLHLVFFL